MCVIFFTRSATLGAFGSNLNGWEQKRSTVSMAVDAMDPGSFRRNDIIQEG